MRLSSTFRVLVTVYTLLSYNVALAQTHSSCDPLQKSCPPDAALGQSVNISFTSGASDGFTGSGNSISYDSNGASFTIRQSGDSPTIVSKWYIMFGRVEIILKAASGVGIVSSVVMQSDDLDEIDWEWLGADSSQVQSNYFGKGQTNLYNRGAFHADPTSQTQFDTYTIDWTASQIVWQINGWTVRVLTPANANGQYPQTPMQIKIGAWSGGDPSNGQGTIAWAGGLTNYAAGPFTMQVKSVTVIDYSKGPLYAYSGTGGAWQDIITLTAAPVIASMSGQPTPGTQFDTTSTYVTPNIYPATSASVATDYSGLPSGWTVTSSGKVVPPPSSAPLTYPVVSFTSSPPVSLLAVCSVGGSDSGVSVIAVGSEVITQYNQQGFLTVVTVPAGYSTMAKSYDSRGFLITPTSMPACPTNVVATATAMSDGPSSAAQHSTPLAYPQVKGTAMVSSSSLSRLPVVERATLV